MDAVRLLQDPLLGELSARGDAALRVRAVQRPPAGSVQQEANGVLSTEACAAVPGLSSLHVGVRDRLHLALERRLGDDRQVFRERHHPRASSDSCKSGNVILDEDIEEHKCFAIQHKCGWAGPWIHISHNVPHFSEYKLMSKLQSDCCTKFLGILKFYAECFLVNLLAQGPTRSIGYELKLLNFT